MLVVQGKDAELNNFGWNEFKQLGERFLGDLAAGRHATGCPENSDSNCDRSIGSARQAGDARPAVETTKRVNAGAEASRCKTCSSGGSRHASPDASGGYLAISASDASAAGFAEGASVCGFRGQGRVKARD